MLVDSARAVIATYDRGNLLATRREITGAKGKLESFLQSGCRDIHGCTAEHRMVYT